MARQIVNAHNSTKIERTYGNSTGAKLYHVDFLSRNNAFMFVCFSADTGSKEEVIPLKIGLLSAGPHVNGDSVGGDS